MARKKTVKSETTDLAQPQNRTEEFLAKIAGLVDSLPQGEFSRLERYLKYIAENGGGGGSGVTSFNTRTGAVTPQSGDYSEFYAAKGSGVTSFNGRTGDVSPQASDYSSNFAPSGSQPPIGEVIFFAGTTAPTNYLACDGSVYNISEYTDLANFIQTNYGSKNYFGGNGTTTFAVPDWRGEFFRASGANSRAGQGSGVNVGAHQDATMHIAPYSGGDQDKTVALTNSVDTETVVIDNTNYYASKNPDSLSITYPLYFRGLTGEFSSSVANPTDAQKKLGPYTSRPTNTSLLVCIRAK